MGGSPGELSEELVTLEKRKKGWRMNCDVGELILQPFRHLTYVTTYYPTLPSLYLCLILQPFPSYHLRHSSLSNPSVTLPMSHSPTFSVTSPMSQLIIQRFRRFTYVTAHYPTLPSLYLRHSLLSNPSVAASTSQLIIHALLILQAFRHITYVTAHYPTLPSLYLRHSSVSNPSFASPTSQAPHLRHLASRPCSQ